MITTNYKELFKLIFNDVSDTLGSNTLYLEEYCQFLTIKIINKDFNSDNYLLSPGYKIDKVWHQHLLHPKKYYKLFRNLKVPMVDHDPNKADDESYLIENRYQNTLNYAKIFFDIEISPDSGWFPNIYSSDKKIDDLVLNNNIVAEEVLIPNNDNKIEIFIKTLTGTNNAINCNLETTVIELKQIYQKISGICIKDMRLFFHKIQLEDEKILKDYNITPYSTLHIVVKIKGC